VAVATIVLALLLEAHPTRVGRETGVAPRRVTTPELATQAIGPRTDPAWIPDLALIDVMTMSPQPLVVTEMLTGRTLTLGRPEMSIPTGKEIPTDPYP